MARQTVRVLIDADGRDKGGVFVLTEMPATEATDLCLRALQMIARGGVDIPAHIFQMGPAGVVTMGAGAILAGLGKTPWYEVKPLLDALLPCVTSWQPAEAVAPLQGWAVIKGQIEEPQTLLRLYEEVISLHLGFSLRERLSYYRDQVQMMVAGSSPTTQTSTDASPRSSGLN